MGSVTTSKAIARRRLAEGSSLGPTFSRRAAASASVRPLKAATSKFSTTSFASPTAPGQRLKHMRRPAATTRELFGE